MADVEFVSFVQHPLAFNREFRSWPGVVGRHMTRVTADVAFFARIEAPKPGGPGHGRTGINFATGGLVSRIETEHAHHGPRRDLEGQVLARSRHAAMVHAGTKPHFIRARRVPHLVFFWHRVGRIVKLKEVFHPGTPADPFLEKALTKVMLRHR